MNTIENINQVKGFLDPEEANLLQASAHQVAFKGAGAEIGSYCGKSSIYLGLVYAQYNQLLFSIDHHLGSEEHQVNEEYHDPDLYDPELQVVNTLPIFQRNLIHFNLMDTVVPIVGRSEAVGAYWKTPLSLLFIDGGHSEETALLDYQLWSPFVVRGGLLCIHDVFLSELEGGQAPRYIYEKALLSGLFTEVAVEKSLRVLRRL